MPSGQLHSYSATLPHKRTVTDRIVMADVMETATMSALGMTNETKFSFVNAPGKVYEWLEDVYASRSDTATASGLTSDSTTTTLSAADGSKFVIGDVILVDNEYMWVSGISTNTLTVTRNYGGTQATHSATCVISVVGSNRLEGAASDTAIWTQPTTGYNYSWIEQRTIEISRTDGRIQQYGIADVVEREIDKKMDELRMLLNLQWFNGQRKAGSSTTPRSAGGLDTFITTNLTSLSSAALTQKALEDEMQDCFTNGGVPNLLICGAWVKRKIADFYAGAVRTERDEKMGGVTIDKILSPLGIEMGVMVDRHCPTSKLYMLDTRYVGGITIDEFFYEELGKTKDTADGGFGQVVGEYGMAVAFEKAHSIISAISTTS